MNRFFVITVALCSIAGLSSGPVHAQPEPKQANTKQVKGNRAVLKQVNTAIDLYVKKDDAEGAIKGLLDALKKEPKNFYANAWLGHIYVKEGNFADAIAPLMTAREADPEDTSTLANLAIAYEMSGDKAKANEVYVDLNQRKPGDAVVLNKIGLYELNQGHNDAAIAAFEAADKAAPNDPLTTANLASAYSAAGQKEMAKSAYSRLVALNPNTETLGTALSWLGFSALMDKDYDSAVSYLERAREVRGNDLEVLNNLGNAYANSTPQQTEKAIACYSKITELDGSLFQPWYNLGVLYIKNGDADKALDANKAALRLRPNDPYVLNNMGRVYEMQERYSQAGDFYAQGSDSDPSNRILAHNAAAAYSKTKEDAKTIKYIERAIALGDESPEFMLFLGNLYSKTGRSQEALKLLEGANEETKGRADYWFNVGILREKLGQKDGAEEAYRKCLAIKPDDIDANTNLALILANKGRWQEATPILESVMGTNPSSLDAKLNVATAYYETGRLKDALALWNEVLAKAPNRTDVRLNVANVQWQLKDFDLAYKNYVQAYKDRPNDAQAMNGMGLWNLRQSQNQEAVKMFRGAIASDSKYMPAYNNLAVALERLNKKSEAIAVLEKALSIEPNFEDARNNLKRMKSGTN